VGNVPIARPMPLFAPVMMAMCGVGDDMVRRSGGVREDSKGQRKSWE